MAIANSGCTSHFLQVSSPCSNKTATSKGLRVYLANDDTIQATHTALLDIPALPTAARTAHIFPHLKNHALVSIRQLCDSGCEAVFTATDVTIRQGTHVILSGKRNPKNGLWMIQISSTATDSATPAKMVTANYANSVYEMKTKTNLVQYLHRCCYSLTTSGWLKAIKAGYLTTWQGLDEHLVAKHLPKVDTTIKGHLRQQYKMSDPRANL